MKKIFIQLVVFSGLLFTSCSTDTDNVSKVTNYPVLELNGEEEIIIPLGGTYNDEGIIATEDGVEIPYTTKVTGTLRGGSTVDTNKADIYSVSYSAINKDGFPGTITRKVIVVDNGDLVTSIAGLYRSTCTRNGVLTAQYTDMEYVLIWKNANGTYQISDGIGLYYAVGRAYGDTYLATPVIVTANSIPANNYTISPFTVGTFGGNCIMSGLNANPANSTVSFSTVWDSGFTFDVVLNKVQI